MLAFVRIPGLAATARLLLTSALLACSAQLNPLGLATPDGQKQSFDVALALGRVHLDSGAIAQAHTYALEAYTRNPHSEEAATLLGFVYLAQAGITPFTLAKQIIANKARSNSGEDPATNSALGGLGPVIGLERADFALLGDLNVTDAELPVIEPICAAEARQRVTKLAHVNNAIAVICPFVNPAVLMGTDERHQCQSLTTKLARQNQAHFLWAFAHLVEAAAFQEVINYATVSEGKSNLELRADKVQALGASMAADPTNLDSFVTAMNDFALIIDRVLQVSGSCSPEYPQSQLVALVNDLTSVSLAFGHMEGVPVAITHSITKAMASITQLQEKAAGNNASESQANAIKSDLTKKMATSLSAAIAGIDKNSYSPEQIDNVCSSYDQISGNVEGDLQRPDLCNLSFF